MEKVYWIPSLSIQVQVFGYLLLPNSEFHVHVLLRLFVCYKNRALCRTQIKQKLLVADLMDEADKL